MINSSNSSKKVVIKIPMYDQYVNYSNLEIRQNLLHHSTFKFVWRISSALIADPSDILSAFNKYLDREVTFCLYNMQEQQILSIIKD